MEKLTGLSHLFVTVFLSGFASFMVIPAITDVNMAALCPGEDECSLAIYLSGFQQAMIGFGTLMMMPLIGNLSDQYGRKALLTLPMTVSVIPLAILAYRRTINFFYAYYVLRTITAMLGEGSVSFLALAYAADNTTERQRASAFGVLSGVASASFVFGTLATRFLSIPSTFQVATIVSMLAVIYMRIFLKDNAPDHHDPDDLTQPLMKEDSEPDANQTENDSTKKISGVLKNIPSVRDLASLLKSSETFSRAAIVAFFNSLADGGLQSSLMYFLRARFHFNKDQFADLMLISGVAGAVSQLLLMPLLVPIIGEERLLSVGLLVGCLTMFLHSLSWAVWVSYTATMCAVFFVFASPCLRSIASKQVGSDEQGKVQGCLSGICSFGNIISPLIFSPLTALFLSSRAPFYFPGFSIMGIGFALFIAFIQSLAITRVSSTSKSQSTSCSTLA